MSDYEEKLGEVRVGIRHDLVVTRQEMSGKPRYVMHDPLSFQNHVFSHLEYRVITGIVNKRGLAANFTTLVERGVMSEARKDEFYDFVLSLHAKNLLQLPIVQADVLFDRYTRKREARKSAWYQAILYYDVPLLNPNRLLNETLHYVRWLFSRTGIVLWGLLMLWAGWNCLGRFPEMFAHAGDLLTLGNLPVMWGALIVLKTIHEFGHAYACKRFGGDVPQMGFAFIVMTPCAYVDAGSSWTFPNRWHRVVVGMAGMYIESIVAGIFALVWASTQPGLLHDVALNVVVLASVATLIMNLNPLLRFDGYYVLSDLLGLINLRQRGDEFLKSHTKWIGLGMPRVRNSYSRSERWVYGLYAPCAFVYKVTLAFAITSMVVMSWPAGGMFLGAAFALLLIFLPLKRLLVYLLASAETAPVRKRARIAAAAVFVVGPLIFWYLPISSNVIVPGVLEPLKRVSVRAPVAGFVEEIGAKHGARVEDGQMICALSNSAFEMLYLRAIGDKDVEAVRLDTEEAVDAAKAMAIRSRLDYLNARADKLTRRRSSMRIHSNIDGALISTNPDGWLGSFVERGDELYQVHSKTRLIRVVMTDHEVMRAHLAVGSEAEVRWSAHSSGAPIRAVVREIRRSSSRAEVPTEVTMLAGGEIYAHWTDEESAIAAQPFLHVFLEPEAVPLDGRTGLTARVRIRARVQTLGQWLRRGFLGFYNSWRMS